MGDDKLIIKCPFCGEEYLPSELFFPEDFLPKIYDVIRDENGCIISYNGNLMNLEEEYVCDKCNHTFKIIADVKFKTVPCEEHDFNYTSIQPIFDRERVELKED